MNKGLARMLIGAGSAFFVLSLVMSAGGRSSQLEMSLPQSEGLSSCTARPPARHFRTRTRIHDPNPALSAAEKAQDPEAKILATASPTVERMLSALERGTTTRLMKWIAARMGWTVKEPPTIRFRTPAQLTEMYFGEGSGSNGVTIRALFEIKTGTIYLSDKWNPKDLRDRSYLLHELVHHLQLLNKVEVACLAEYNRNAYYLQFEWLREQGVQDPQEFLGINDVALFAAGQCPLFEGY